MRVVVAVDGLPGRALASGLAKEGCHPIATPDARAAADAADDALLSVAGRELLDEIATADTLVLELRRDTISPALVSICDRSGVRIVPLAADPAAARLAELYGIGAPLPLDVEAWRLHDALATHTVRPADVVAPRGRIVAVWGPAGAPGRSTVAVELAMELARDGRRVGLVDADSHAPSLALALGLADEGPGFAAACRSAERGAITPAELSRISTPLGPHVEVLTGINRPGRWPELSESRVAAALDACRAWVDDTIVDVAAPLERDEEIVSDLDGPRRNAATLAAVRTADLVVAVTSADPVGMARLVRALPDLRATIGATPVLVVVNKLRPGALGVDARGQVRQTLERFTGIRDVWFLPLDTKATDAAMLSARPVLEVSGRSALSAAVRRFVGDALATPGDALGEVRARTPRRAERRRERRVARTA